MDSRSLLMELVKAGSEEEVERIIASHLTFPRKLHSLVVEFPGCSIDAFVASRI